MTTDAPAPKTAGGSVILAGESEPEHDTLAFVSTSAGVFAVASVRSADEARIYRVEATDVEEAPLAVTLAGKVRFHEGDAPGRVVADDEGHALVTLDRDGTIATIDPVTAERGADAAKPDAPLPTNAMITRGDTSAYVDDGDAYLIAGGDEDFSRVGAPGVTRAVALADVADLRVVALQTESPRMLVFFAASDATNPLAFEALE